MEYRSIRRLAWATLVAGFVLALAFALYTNHVWEDYYITYRASRNLAQGHGLVFNVGDRLHTFTSPLGTLLPALASYVTGTNSDAGALWVFRVMSAAALGGAGWLMVRALARPNLSWLAVIFPAVWLVTDAKTLDFTINGMETAFMLLFLAYALWAHLADAPRRWLHLGLAWAGLMWTRPDSFIYVGLLAAGCWFFNDAALTRRNRRELLVDFLKAGAVTTALYLPWLLIATAYYGTPVPHTVAAKGSIPTEVPHTFANLLLTAAQLPYLAWTRFTSLETTFLPSYYMIGGWPAGVVVAARALATLASVVWLLPRMPAFARAASFTFFGVHVYLTFFPYFPFPWYVPNAAIFGAVALGGLLGALTQAKQRVWRGLALAVAGHALAASAWLSWETARQVRVQQELVEDGGRQRIGEWLAQHAQRGDTVFLEPLGYIGYFSNLKTFDFPGMSSREMVEARRIVGPDWAHLIQWLQPTFVVLRPLEQERVSRAMSGLLSTHYAKVQDFDTLAAVRAQDIHGRAYLEHDSRFSVFQLQRPTRHAAHPNIRAPYAPSTSVVDGVPMVFLHAPSTMTVPVPPGAQSVTVAFGFSENCAEGPNPTNGAAFTCELRDGFDGALLFSRTLHPTANPADRLAQRATFALPPRRQADAILVFRVDELGSSDKDWTHWAIPEFH